MSFEWKKAKLFVVSYSESALRVEEAFKLQVDVSLCAFTNALCSTLNCVLIVRTPSTLQRMCPCP